MSATLTVYPRDEDPIVLKADINGGEELSCVFETAQGRVIFKLVEVFGGRHEIEV